MLSMCGRFTLSKEEIEADTVYGVIRNGVPSRRYNVAPSQKMPVILLRDQRATLEPMRWGWLPSWADHDLINAQGETIDTKPTFKKAFAEGRRCLVPADGFYEWQKQASGGKQPFRFVLGEGEPLFFFAGLWQSFPVEGEPDTRQDCFLLLTTAANDVVSPVHNRMPVMLTGKDALSAWLAPDPEQAKPLARHQAGGLLAYPVSKAVNNARNDDPACAAKQTEGS